MEVPVYNIVIADDHEMFRQGLRKVLEDVEGLRVIAEAGSSNELQHKLRYGKPHMVIMDISMPARKGLEATRKIKTTRPGIKVLILSMHRSAEYLVYALCAGAEGYVLKEDNPTELLAAIQSIRQGRTCISRLFADELPCILDSCAAGTDFFSPLTVEERKILELAIRGKTSEEIAAHLSVKIPTVRRHRKNIMKKMSIKEAIGILSWAIKEEYDGLLLD